MKLKLLALAVTLLVLSMLPVLTTAINYTDGESHSAVQSGGIVILRDQPIASYDGGLPGYAATKPAPGQKLDLNSPAAQAYSQYLTSKHDSAKQWLSSNLPEIQVTNEYSVTINGFSINLNGRPLYQLGRLPGVLQVTAGVKYTIEMNRSPKLIGAPAAWAAVGGQANAGAGIKIGIIDTGIDTTHPFLTDNSLAIPPGFPKCDAKDSAVGVADTSCKFVSNKVIVAKVFNEPGFDFDAFAAQPHGSHVSGTAAGVANTCAPLVGCTLSGIAPKAYLGNYNVFPGDTTEASSEVIAVAVEAAVKDGMDVLNLSLGGLATTGQDPLVDAVNAAADAGVIVAIAAGNSGPFAGSIESPGIASGVITAGASTNPHFVGVPATENNAPGTTFGVAVGAGPSYGSPTTAVLALWPGDNRACSTVSGTPFTGKIVLIRRGVCTFSLKDKNAAAAGAIGMIVTNSVAGDPVAMGAAFPFVIPGVMVGIGDRPALLNYINSQGNNAIISVNGAAPAEFFSDGAGADILAGFSSIGPPILVDLKDPAKSLLVGLIKPDVTAPGVNVYSSVTSDQCDVPPCFAFFSGTSMATPHVAGSAAVLKQLHPNWSPDMIKSVLVSTAKRPVGAPSNNSPLNNPMSRGGGRIDLAAALKATAIPITDDGQPSVDFGGLGDFDAVRKHDVSVNSITTTTITYTITLSEAAGGACGCVSVSAGSITVTPGDGPSFSVVVRITHSVAPGDYFGDIVLSGGPVNLVIPYWLEFNPHNGGGNRGQQA